MMTPQSEISQLVDHLFRHESGRLVAVLTRIFGIENLELAQDVVQDALVEAIHHWQYKGIPDNPSAWLFRVAKNKAVNQINRDRKKIPYSSDAILYLQSKWTAGPALEHYFSEEEIQDDVLRMIFACCHPAISPDSQIALALRTLCGFSIPEIARAFLTSEENIAKRLVRARKSIRDGKVTFDIPAGVELEKRLDAVLATAYLLFNEGYSASNGNDLIRYELCEEAIRLVQIIACSKTVILKDDVYGLLALMYLNASRFKARLDEKGNILTMAQQDRSKWDAGLRDKGLACLNQAGQDNKIGFYHLLAGISACHSTAPDYKATDWQSILYLYDCLVNIDSSPLILLNRTIAVCSVRGPETAIEEIQRIENIPSLRNYHLLYSTKAEFYIQSKQYSKAAVCLETSIRLTSVPAEKEMLRNRLDFCKIS